MRANRLAYPKHFNIANKSHINTIKLSNFQNRALCQNNNYLSTAHKIYSKNENKTYNEKTTKLIKLFNQWSNYKIKENNFNEIYKLINDPSFLGELKNIYNFRDMFKNNLLNEYEIQNIKLIIDESILHLKEQNTIILEILSLIEKKNGSEKNISLEGITEDINDFIENLGKSYHKYTWNDVLFNLDKIEMDDKKKFYLNNISTFMHYKYARILYYKIVNYDDTKLTKNQKELLLKLKKDSEEIFIKKYLSMNNEIKKLLIESKTIDAILITNSLSEIMNSFNNILFYYRFNKCIYSIENLYFLRNFFKQNINIEFFSSIDLNLIKRSLLHILENNNNLMEKMNKIIFL